MSLLAETCSLVGDTASAPVIYRLLAPWATLNVVDPSEGIRGSVARYLGLLATVNGRWEEGELHFEDAFAMNTNMGARPWLAYTARDYARLLNARNGQGDPARAEALRERARELYVELGMESHTHALSG